MDFRDWRLEDIDIPDDYLKNGQDDLYWESDDLSVFYLCIQPVLYKGKEAVSYGIDILPFENEDEDWLEVQSTLENKGYEPDGDGWESYMRDCISQENPDLAVKVQYDSESDSCGLYVLNSMEDYRALLGQVDIAVRGLL